MDQTYHIIRTDHKATYFGRIANKTGDEVILHDARRLWHWSGAADVLQLAQEGTKNPQDCRFTMAIPSMTVLGVREMLPVTAEAAESIKGVEDWKEERKPPF